MNIVLDIPQYNIFNLFFLEKKQNIIMDGTFTKFIYSNQHFILNSLYLYFPIEIKYLEKTPIKTRFVFILPVTKIYNSLMNSPKSNFILLNTTNLSINVPKRPFVYYQSNSTMGR